MNEESQKAIDQGLCRYCHEVRERKEVTSCNACCEKRNAAVKKSRDKASLNGLCIGCKQPKDGNNKVYCIACAIRNREKVRKYQGSQPGYKVGKGRKSID